MNYRFVINQLALLLTGLSITMLLVGVWAAIDLRSGVVSELPAMQALLWTGLGGALCGGALWALTRQKDVMLGRKEALLLVATSWLLGAALSGVPYYAWAHWAEDPTIDQAFLDPINCYFEAMSGLTTTGATVLSDIESVPPSLLLWRSLTHWFGGLGIVVLFVAVLPSLGAGGKKLFRVEAPGPTPEGVHPHIRETARVLWLVYVALTFAEVLALRVAGMSWHDSLCHTFATLATGGFSTNNASIAGYDSVWIDVIIIVFMVLAGINFGLYIHIMRARAKLVWQDTEFRCYMAMLIIGSLIVFTAVMTQASIPLTSGEELDTTTGQTMREAVFTTVSVQTTTGFCTADFDQWPFIAKAVLLGLMFVGGSAGSTGGGIKVIRVWMTFKIMLGEIEKAFRPNVVRPLKIGGAAIDPDLKLATLAYVMGIFVLFIVGAILIMMIESAAASDCDFVTASTASIATLCNIGPGLARVGTTQNYGWFSDWTKIVMILLMALGRLEVFAIIVLFMPTFWRSD